MTAYTLYAALEDAAGNRSLASATVMTGDATNPTLTLSAAAAAGASSATLFYVSSEDGAAFLWADTNPSLTLAEVVALALAAGSTAAATALAAAEHQFTGLAESTAYTLYVVVEDAAGNQATATAAVTTRDATAPALALARADAGASTATAVFTLGEAAQAWLWAEPGMDAGVSAGDARALAGAGAALDAGPGRLSVSGLDEATAYTLHLVAGDTAGNLALVTATVTTRDATPPQALALVAEAGASTAALTYVSNEAGTAFLWADTRAGLGARAVATLAAAGASSPTRAGELARHEFAGLAESTTYTLYVVAEDAAGNRALASLAVATLDATAPSAGPLVAAAGARTATLSFVPDEDARAWLLRRHALRAGHRAGHRRGRGRRVGRGWRAGRPDLHRTGRVDRVHAIRGAGGRRRQPLAGDGDGDDRRRHPPDADAVRGGRGRGEQRGADLRLQRGWHGVPVGRHQPVADPGRGGRAGAGG